MIIMSMREKKIFINLLIAFSFLCFSTLLAGEKATDGSFESGSVLEVVLGSGKTSRKYLLMNNGLDKYRWYYAALNPKLCEFGNPAEPDLTLVKFQRVGKRRKNKLDEGAFFSCSFDIGADETITKMLRKYLPKGIEQSKAKLSVIPLEVVELSFIDSKRKEQVKIIATDSMKLVPMANSIIRFNTVLDKNTAILVETLLKSDVGLEYEIKYKYSVFSKLKSKSFNASLNRNKAFINIENEVLEARLSNYIKNKERNPKFIQFLKSESSKASKTKDSNTTNNDNKSADLKNIGHKNKAKASFITSQSLSDFQKTMFLTYRNREDRVIAGSGFISLKKYGENVISKKIYQDTSELGWNYAYLIMPEINENLSYDVIAINTIIEVKCKNKVLESRKYLWTKEKGWRDFLSNSPVSIEKFGLENIYSESGSDPLKYSVFNIKSNIIFNDGPPVVSEFEIPVVKGESPVCSPFSLVDVVTFDFTNLTWDSLVTDKTRLVAVELRLKDGNRTIRRDVKAEKIPGTKVVESPDFLYVITNLNSFEKGNLKASVYFRRADGKRIPWEYNSLVLNKFMDEPYIMLLDEDWKTE